MRAVIFIFTYFGNLQEQKSCSDGYWGLHTYLQPYSFIMFFIFYIFIICQDLKQRKFLLYVSTCMGSICHTKLGNSYSGTTARTLRHSHCISPSQGFTMFTLNLFTHTLALLFTHTLALLHSLTNIWTCISTNNSTSHIAHATSLGT